MCHAQTRSAWAWLFSAPYNANVDYKPAYLIGGGRSVHRLDWDKIQKSGIFCMGIDHEAWLYVGDTVSQIASIKPDSLPLKLLQNQDLVKWLPENHGDRPIGKMRIRDLDNVRFFRMNANWFPEQFLESPTVSSGHAIGTAGGIHSSILPALWILYEQRYRNVTLLGCDFDTEEPSHDYWSKLNKLLVQLNPVFEARDFWITNGSDSEGALTAFRNEPSITGKWLKKGTDAHEPDGRT